MADDIIRVLLVDDHPVVRDGLRLMLGMAAGVRVAAEAENAAQAMARIREQDFDVAIVDVAMPGTNGLELLQALRARRPALAVLMLSTYAEEVYALRSLRLGASGYLVKSTPAATLLEAVRKAAAGGRYVSPSMTDRFVGMLAGGNLGVHDVLSNRELEVMRRIAQGEGLVQIAESLHLSPKTVTTYRARIMEKMGLHNNVELVRYAMEHGLLL